MLFACLKFMDSKRVYLMKRFIALVIFVACAATLAGCETMKGAGRDIEDTGHNIQKTAS